MPAVPAQPTPHVRPAWTYRLAMGVTYVVSPLSMAPLLFALVLVHAGAPGREVARVTALALVFFGLIPLAYLVWMVRKGRLLSLEVRDRTRRPRPFLVGLGASVAGLLAVWTASVTVPALVAALAACLVVNTAVLALVTLRWKVSVHAASVAGFVSILGFVAMWPGLSGTLLRPATVGFALPLLPLVMWARVHAKTHTPAQVWAGTLFGLVAPPAELYLCLTTDSFGTLFF